MKKELRNKILDELVDEPRISGFYPLIRQALSEYVEKYGAPKWVGRNRVVWKVKKDSVEKLPRNEKGIFDNTNEVSVYNQSLKWKKEDRTYARCKTKNLKNGIPVCIMEYTNPLTKEERESPALYDLISFTDCGQVGRTKDGRYVAFDYGHF